MNGPSNLYAVAEGEVDFTVGADRCVIQQLAPGLRIKCRHLLRQTTQGSNELLGCGLGGNQGGDPLCHLVVLSLDAIVPGGQFIVRNSEKGLCSGLFRNTRSSAGPS